MTTTKRWLGTRAFRTGPIGFERGQSAPLVLDQQTTQLGILGPKGIDVLVAHRRDCTSLVTSLSARSRSALRTDKPRYFVSKASKC